MMESSVASLYAMSCSESKAQISTLADRLPEVVMICSTVEGFSEGWLLGAALIDGESDGIEEGSPEILGLDVGCTLGIVDIEGDSEGIELGKVDGWLLGSVDGSVDGIEDGSPDKLGLSLG